jgi:hypothetical protein
VPTTVGTYYRRYNRGCSQGVRLLCAEALVFVIVGMVAMPLAIVIPISVSIHAAPLEAAKDPAGDVFARIRFPPTASILVAYYSNLSNLIDPVVAPERIQSHGRWSQIRYHKRQLPRR